MPEILTTTLPALDLTETGTLSSEIVSLLERVIWGTEGARYSLCDYEPTLRHIPGARFLELKKEERLIAVRMIIEKRARRGADGLHCFYHSMFAVDPSEKGKGYGKTLAKAMLERLRPQLAPQGLIYSHVELDNLRSLRIHQALSYQPIGKFFAMTFSRLFPKSSLRLKKLIPEERQMVVDLLNKQYRDHALTDFALSLSADDYYVIKDSEKLMAGVQILPQRWTIRSLGGTGGAIALHALPHVPLVRRLFNPKDFHFLKLGNLFFRNGHADAAQELVEAVLSRFARNTAMMFWDHRSPVYQEFAAAGSFGLLNSLTQTPVQIMGLFQGFKESEISDFSSRPASISPIDL